MQDSVVITQYWWREMSHVSHDAKVLVVFFLPYLIASVDHTNEATYKIVILYFNRQSLWLLYGRHGVNLKCCKRTTYL